MECQPASAERAAGHPFRAAIPAVRAHVRKQEDDGDLKLFLLSYTAFFICFYTFIA